jgi:hypothetical protein
MALKKFLTRFDSAAAPLKRRYEVRVTKMRWSKFILTHSCPFLCNQAPHVPFPLSIQSLERIAKSALEEEAYGFEQNLEQENYRNNSNAKKSDLIT